MTVDYRELNKVAPLLHVAVPSVIALMNQVNHKLGTYHCVLDLANAFFFTPIAPESQEQFAFLWKVGQWTFQALTQGYLHSPTLCHGFLATDLAEWAKPEYVKLCDYIDDILLTSNSLADLEAAAPTLVGKNGRSIKTRSKGLAYLSNSWVLFGPV